MNSFRAGELAISIEEWPGRFQLRWKGKSTARQPGQVLDPFFAEVLAAAARNEAYVEMRFEELDHFNSSTIGCLIRLIQDARDVGVKVVFAYDDKCSWQRLSFDALRAFTRDNPLLELQSARG